MITETVTIPADVMLTMFNSLNHYDRRWLAEQMAAQVKREEAEAEERFKEFMSISPSSWEDDSDARLDDALACFHKDWGGDKSPVEIANELRQGAEMVRNVENW